MKNSIKIIFTTTLIFIAATGLLYAGELFKCVDKDGRVSYGSCGGKSMKNLPSSIPNFQYVPPEVVYTPGGSTGSNSTESGNENSGRQDSEYQREKQRIAKDAASGKKRDFNRDFKKLTDLKYNN